MPPVVTVASPNGGERVFTGAPYGLRWDVEHGEGATSYDVQISTNNGASYSTIAGCAGLPASARSCAWPAPGPASTKARIRVIARNGGSEVAADASNAYFTIMTGTPVVTVISPNTAVNWGRGSTQQIKWSHNLGANAHVRIDASRDGGTTYSTVAASVKNNSSTSGSFYWTLSVPNTTAALIRISALDLPATDTSNSVFVVADPYINVATVKAGTDWGYGTQRQHTWTTNLGPIDQVNVLLSTDAGQTFQRTLATGIVATAKRASFITPVLPSATMAARLRVAWANAPAGGAAAGTTSTNFQVAPPYLRLTSPNGGERWSGGAAAAVTWMNNLGGYESIRLDLSTDGGQTFATTVVPSTASDGSHTVIPTSGWASGQAVMRGQWLSDAAVSDVSNSAFTITAAP
jgi:hypothetical protein